MQLNYISVSYLNSLSSVCSKCTLNTLPIIIHRIQKGHVLVSKFIKINNFIASLVLFLSELAFLSPCDCMALKIIMITSIILGNPDHGITFRHSHFVRFPELLRAT